MTKLQTAVVSAVVVAGVATPLVIQHDSKLRQENQALRQQADQFAGLAAEKERLSNLVAEANNARSLQNDQLNDLMRLRNEVGMLRQQTNELLKLRDENRRLQADQGKPRQKLPTLDQLETVMDETVQMQFPREKWAFAGYTNPENTIVSLATAALAGDLETFLNSMTPEFQARQRENMQKDGKTEVQWRDQLVKEFGRTESITVLRKGDISENEVILTLLIDNGGGRIETPKMKVQRIGNEWKVAGHPIRESPDRTEP